MLLLNFGSTRSVEAASTNVHSRLPLSLASLAISENIVFYNNTNYLVYDLYDGFHLRGVFKVYKG